MLSLGSISWPHHRHDQEEGQVRQPAHVEDLEVQHVSFANALSEPRTVVVQFRNADTAVFAVRGMVDLGDAAYLTERDILVL